jgi:MFS family permease
VAEPRAARGSTRGLVAACLAASLMPLNSTMIAVAVPDIAADLGGDPSTVTQAIVATYLVAAIALQSPGGKLGDRIGQWRAFGFGQVLLAVGALAGFLAPTLWMLSGSRVLMAAGGAIVVPATVALLRTELPDHRSGQLAGMYGVFGSAMSLAAGIGPLIGGELTRWFGWPSIFLANVPVLIVSAALALTATHEPTPRRPARFDWTGSVLLAALLVCLVSAVETSGTTARALFVTGVLLLAPFVVVERRAADPVVAFRLFRNVRFAAGTLVIALLNLVMYALLFELPLVIDHKFGVGAADTGRLLVFLLLAMVLTSLGAGRLSNRFGPRPLGVLGVLMSLASVVMMWALPLNAPSDLRVPLLMLGIGLGLANPAAQAASMTAIDRADSGMAAGVNSTMRYLGGIVGVAILGGVLDFAGSPADVDAGHHLLLSIFLGVLVLTVGCAALLGPRQKSHTISARE